jgi:pimeloyl-ACP methyl ester carboxylesterase
MMQLEHTHIYSVRQSNFESRLNKARTIKLKFPGGNGHSLDARLELPAHELVAYAVFCHCFTCSKETLAAFRVSRYLASHGYAVLRFDFTGLGGSDCDFAQTSFATNVADIHAAIDWLDIHYRAPALLLGHSLGGTAALEAAVDAASIRAVVTIASPSQPDHVLHHFGHALTLLEHGLPASIEVGGRHFDIDPSFIEDLRNYDMQQRLALLHKPVLIFRVTHDTLVANDNADEIHRWLAGPSRIIDLEKANHMLSNERDAQYIAREIVAWFKQNVIS